MGAIGDAIRKSKCKKLDRSFRGSEYISKFAIVKGENAKLAVSKDPLVLSGLELKTLYYSMLDTYYSKRSINLSLAPSTKKSTAFWDRVVEKREKSGVSPEDFIRAQFDYFSKTFKCAPALPCLVTEAAVTRAQAFTGIIGNVVAGAKEVSMDKADLMRWHDEQIRAICKAQKMDKETFYRQFVLTGAHEVPSFYLQACPVYKRITGK